MTSKSAPSPAGRAAAGFTAVSRWYTELTMVKVLGMGASFPKLGAGLPDRGSRSVSKLSPRFARAEEPKAHTRRGRFPRKAQGSSSAGNFSATTSAPGNAWR